ncbi:CAP domain-containing protein [Clostridium taeniosporum]|uniref:Serine protease n=1 Tax=Clostridium taeniosporum TaxID=394958 RepID=A0A1D7XP24_9CLOT|nr:CAP domain-containing protein [Clostridium taeniosporum]AOR23858.1 serine protease [Clostridium taeniosporum]AOR25083.1 serine protease [Clostridium taeniosporum]
MKKAFLRRIIGGVVAVATITSLNPLGVSAAGKNNNCNITKSWSKVYGTWFCLGSNGEIKLEDYLNNYIKNNKTSCNLQFGWVKRPTKLNDSVIANNDSADTTAPEVNNGSNDTTVVENNNGSNDTTIPNTSEDNKGKDDITVPNVTEDNNGSNDVTTPNTNVNEGTTAPEKPVDKEENVQPTSGDSVNVSGLSKLPEKYSISIQSNAENKILQLMNEKRVQAGLQPLTMDNTLLKVARYKSNHMIQYNYFDHTNPDGTKWTNWLQAIGYKYNTTGENIAYNTYDPVELFNQWWNSKGHRDNMMNPAYNKVGIGVIYDKDNNKYMGTQTFSN